MRSATAGAGAFSRKGRTILLVAALLAVVATLGVAGGKKEAPAATGTAGTPLVASPGVLVTAVQAGSPAEKAGIQRGDIILEADGKAVNTPPELAAAIDAHKAGDTMTLKLRHGDAEKTVSASLSNQQGRAWLGIAAGGGRLGLGAGRGFGGFGNGLRNGGQGGPIVPGNGLRNGPRTMLLGTGAYVTAVTAGGPAEKAGLVQGDLILAMDGTAVDPQHTLADQVAAKKAGDTVTLSVQSSAQPTAHDVKITLGKNPDKDGAWLGIQYSLIGPRIGRPFGGDGRGFGGTGVVVAEVQAGSPAEKAGIKASDLIAKVDGNAVTDPQQVVDAVAKHKPGDTIPVTVTRAGSTVDLSVVLGASPADASKAYMGVSMSAAVQRVIPNAPVQGSGQGAAGGSQNTLDAPTL
jgi:S1-C subfamily serine protease